MPLKNWNWFEKIWLLSFSGVALILSVLWKDTLFGFSVFLSGVICVVLAAKGSIWTYAWGMYNTLGHAWISWQSGLYGETMLNALYFFPMQIVGWWLWRERMNEETVQMRKISPAGGIALGVLCALGTWGYGWWLSTLPGQQTPYMDSLTNVLSVAAQILMALRYREQWALWIIINMVSVAMWSLRLTDGAEEAATMVAMWSAYLVNSVYGWISWSRGADRDMKEEKHRELTA
ncbi:nicotinamide riboside transporter PnuC [Staphylospora marina]|uniref:nicotinamide riboside transporter PnuC n=1 Tax=Staphylospora marina TaxID=2490858 RepID=UPI000F5BB0BA|nr:nicotinamide riboside transporter PnuC [Staphylospora marina]